MNPIRRAILSNIANARHRHYGGDLAEYRPHDYQISKPIETLTADQMEQTQPGLGCAHLVGVQTSQK